MSTPLRSKSVRPSRRTSAAAFTADPPEPDDPLLGFAPYLHVAPPRSSITPERQRAFIAALAASGIVTQAARAIGVSLEALYKLRHLPGAEVFSAAWDIAIKRGIGRLEDCALELAIAGEELPMVSAGQLLGTYRKHNFGHIRFLLSQRLRGKYGGGAVSSVGDLAKLDPADPALRKLRAQWQAEYEAASRRAPGPPTRPSWCGSTSGWPCSTTRPWPAGRCGCCPMAAANRPIPNWPGRLAGTTSRSARAKPSATPVVMSAQSFRKRPSPLPLGGGRQGRSWGGQSD